MLWVIVETFYALETTKAQTVSRCLGGKSCCSSCDWNSAQHAHRTGGQEAQGGSAKAQANFGQAAQRRGGIAGIQVELVSKGTGTTSKPAEKLCLATPAEKLCVTTAS
jgi:hypothetical protein